MHGMSAEDAYKEGEVLTRSPHQGEILSFAAEMAWLRLRSDVRERPMRRRLRSPTFAMHADGSRDVPVRLLGTSHACRGGRKR